MKKLVLSLAFFFMTSACWTQTAEEVLGEMSKRLAGFEDYQVTVDGEFWVKGPKTKDKASSSSKILAKGLKQYNKTTGKDAKGNLINRLQIFDGKTSWDFDRVKGVIRKVNLSKMGEDVLKRLKELQDPTNLGLLGGLTYTMVEKEIEGRRYYVLTAAKPVKVGNQRFDKVVLWIDAESYLPYKTEMETVTEIKAAFSDSIKISQGTVQEFRDWKVNLGIPDYRFSLSIPKGVKVIDETEKAKEVAQIFREQREREEAVKGKMAVAAKVKESRERGEGEAMRNAKSE